MSKRTLLVGVNKFEPDIPELRGCINDTVEMRELLKGYFGFQEADIRVMHDGDASAHDIQDDLGWLLSEYDGDGRDVRVFHFSSHGAQVDDQSDEMTSGNAWTKQAKRDAEADAWAEEYTNER